MFQDLYSIVFVTGNATVLKPSGKANGEIALPCVCVCVCVCVCDTHNHTILDSHFQLLPVYLLGGSRDHDVSGAKYNPTPTD